MLTFLIAILGILLTILLVVTTHEFGHFIAARLLGVKVLRFSIGFGKPFYRLHDKKGTEYALAPIPLGGYVKMLDEQEGEVSPTELHLAYNRQPLYKRFLIVLGGPLFNLLFAFILYWILFTIGFTTLAPIVGKVLPNSIAAEAGMQPAQEIISVNHSPATTWMNAVIAILTVAGEKGQLPMEVREPKTRQIKTLNLNLLNWRLDDLKPEPLESLGIIPFEPTIPPIIEKIESNSNAFSKLLPGDRIISIDNKPIKDWNDIARIISINPAKTLSFVIKRNQKTIKTDITIGTQHTLFLREHGFLGLTPQFKWPEELLRKQQFGALDAISHAWHESYDLIQLNFIMIGKILTGKVSIKSLGGPITIFESAGAALNHGFVSFLGFLAFLSIAIGIINILPIPGLDGGHLLLQAIELITRRPLALKLQLLFYRLGMILLLMLVFQALVNDFLRM